MSVLTRHRRHLAFAVLALGIVLLHGVLVPPLWSDAQPGPVVPRVGALQVRSLPAAPEPALPAPVAPPAAPLAPQADAPPQPPAQATPPATAQSDAPSSLPHTDADTDLPPAVAEPSAPASPSPTQPTYPTVLAPAQRLAYHLRRGPQSGEAELRWEPADERYHAVFEGRLGNEALFTWSSRGAIDNAGIAPERFVQRSKRGAAQATNFRRDVGRISFSGGGMDYLLVPAAQDRLTWLLQLPAVLQAAPERFEPGSRVTLFVAGTRGEAGVWVFQVVARETLELPSGAVQTLRLLRQPPGPYGTQAEVWLDPQRHHLPVRVRLTNNGSEALELTLAD
jgi:hypothetical protein